MQTYKYKAVSKNGRNVNGVIEAYDEYEAVHSILETCEVVTKITEVKPRSDKMSELFSSSRIPEKQLAMMCSQFSIILKAGVPITHAVEIIAEQTENRPLKKVLNKVAGDVASGYSLAQSFETKGEKLPKTLIEMIRAGEESGTLDESFARLERYFTKSARIRGSVVSAMTYPAFVIVVAIVVVIVVMTEAVPAFSGVFAGMGTEMPAATKALIAVSGFFQHYILYVILAIAALVVGMKVWSTNENGHMRVSRFALRLPVLGKINRMKSASQFANTMATLLTSGLPVARAVTTTGRVIDNYYFGKNVFNTVGGIESGRRLGECLAECEYFPKLLAEMTSVGEESGSLEETLDVIAEFYDNEVETSTKRAISLLEPIIICLLAIVVVVILLAVYLPMFNMYDSVI